MKRESMNRAIEERFLASLGTTVGMGAAFVLLTIAGLRCALGSRAGDAAAAAGFGERAAETG